MFTTQAIVIPEPGRVEVREVALVEPGPDDLVVRTAYTSISAGTERMLLAGRMPHPMLSLPVVPGYETVGQVVGLGAQVPPEYEGRWVYIGGARCFVGVNPAWGGQSATLVVDYRRAVPLDGIAPVQGVLLALAATALHGVDLVARGGTAPTGRPETAGPADVGARLAGADGTEERLRAGLAGRRVLVLGQGPVGQLAARLARGRGAWVAVTDRVDSRLARAVADVSLHVADAPPSVEAIGPPVDIIVEATGSIAALAQALPLLAENGMILLLGYYDELRLPYMPLFLKQAQLLTAREWAPGDLARCRDLLASGALDVAGLITHRIPVSYVQEAYRVALDDPECLKLVIEWEM